MRVLGYTPGMMRRWCRLRLAVATTWPYALRRRRPHVISMRWSSWRICWVCEHCRRRIRFAGGSEPVHRGWWRHG